LLREADRQLGLLDAVNNAIPDPRSPLLVLHPQRTLLAQRILGIACGYEDLNDHQQLRDDPLWQTATDHPEPNDDPTLASPPTLCRMENRITRPSLVQLSQILVEQYISSYVIPPEAITFDFDGTDDTIYGNQECGFFNGYYESYCYLPLYVYSGSQLLVAYLRPANIAGNHHAAAILKLLVTRIRQAWPSVRITIRGDSAFCRWRLMRWCESNDIRYIFGLGRNSALERLSSEWRAQAQTAHDLDGQTHRTFGRFSYSAETWDRSRRVIVKAEHLCGPDGGRANPRYIVTNLSGDPQALYEDVYCQRGDMENRIKEQQLGLFADRTSCQSFLANQFRVLLAAFAYVLIEHIRRTALVGTELATAQVSTIRLRLFRVAALVTVSVRRVLVNLAASFVSRDLFVHVAEVLRRSGPLFNSS
jgi:hypothetical protein